MGLKKLGSIVVVNPSCQVTLQHPYKCGARSILNNVERATLSAESNTLTDNKSILETCRLEQAVIVQFSRGEKLDKLSQFDNKEREKQSAQAKRM